ncbi:MAG: DUF2332 domain-containing protein [Actinobacteria bacterium]|nr:DUF2332 domain-containing protein [Actinomycetota bacterium]
MEVDREGASRWLERQLAEPSAPDILTVVWQSITRQYWPAEESAAVDALIDAARQRQPIAHISMEGVPPADGGDGYTIAAHGPELRLDGRLVARSHHHGPPVVLMD